MKINRILTTTVLLAMSVAAAMAETLTPGQALSRFMGDTDARSRAAVAAEEPRLMHTMTTNDGEASLYIFERADRQGMMILSADDLAYPLLGILDEGDFDPDNMPPSMKWWLDEYSRQIEYARSLTVNPKIAAAAVSRAMSQRAGRESIAPMLKTRWDQGEPYNNRCPLLQTQRTWTGCVATSMAQVMKYFNYPEKGKGNLSYTCGTLEKKLTLNLNLKKFDWDNMLETYTAGNYNETQATAVAYLMQACGYSVKMEYGLDSSGALAMNVRNAMVKYFGYDGNSYYALRDLYSTTEWNQLMYDNLKNVGPVIYGGGSNLGGGHSFVCDGYDSESGLFHFNWGWTGMSNGYFSLDALNPSALGTGGGAGGGYNFTQDGVFGMCPPTGQPVVERPNQLTMQGSLVAEIDKATEEIVFDLDMQQDAMWVNYNPASMTFNVYAKVEAQGAQSVPRYYKISNRNCVVDPGYGIMPHHVDSLGVDHGINPRLKLSLLRNDLADGNYKVTIVTAETTATSGPYLDILCPHGYYDYVNVVKSGSNIQVSDIPAPSLDVVSAKFTTSVNPNALNKISVEMKNNSTVELSTGMAPMVVYQGTPLYLGESVFLTVQPGETVVKEWTTSLYTMVQNYSGPSQETKMDLFIFDERSYLFYDFTTPVMIQRASSPDVTIEDPKVINATRVEDDDLKNVPTTYYINDPYDIKVSTRLKLNSGEFNYRFTSCLCKLDEVTGQAAIMAVGSFDLFYSSRLSKTVKTELSYSSMIPGETYLILSAYEAPQGYIPLDSSAFCYVKLETAGVEDITADADNIHVDFDRSAAVLGISSMAGIETVEVYTAGGQLVAHDKSSGNETLTLDMSGVPTGVLIVKAVDTLGNVKTVKVVR
ncbi:MAG: C10 family peptidase [Clostridiales bacterium]|nr:C10 family peptidase [Clostridiales bacterium]